MLLHISGNVYIDQGRKEKFAYLCNQRTSSQAKIWSAA